MLPILLVPLLVAGAVPGAECPVSCAGPGPHDALLSAALACAGPEGTVRVTGACRLQDALSLNLPGQVLRGSCGASLARILPAAAPSFLRPSAVLILGSGASRVTVRDLVLEGAGDGIATSPRSGQVPSGQPDDVRIHNCRIRAGLQYPGAGIRHLGMNGPPFNDLDRCSGSAAGVATGWRIDRNDVRSERGAGIVIGGSGFLVIGNEVRATSFGIVAENNTKTGAVQPFGAPPSNHDNLFADNWVAVIGNDALPAGEVPTCFVDVGLTAAPVTIPDATGCDRGYNTAWRDNCCTVTPDGAGGRDRATGIRISGNGNAAGSVTVKRNQVTAEAPLSGAAGGNIGVETAGARNARVRHNVFVGAGDYPFLSLREDATGNLYERNRFGPGHTSDPHFVHDFGVRETNCYRRNEYCEAHEVFEGEGVDLDCSVHNRAGRTCDGLPVRCPLPPARPVCSSAAASR